MKIIYTQKKSSSQTHKGLIFAFECMLLAFVMCFFGMLLAKQRLNNLEEKYEGVILSHKEEVKDAIELIIPLEDNENG